MVKNIKIDKIFIVVTVILVLFGLIMVYSSTMKMAKERFGDSFYFLKKQLIWLSIGLTVFVGISLLKYPLYLNQKVVFFAMIVSVAGLVLVFFSGKVKSRAANSKEKI